jgi:hypothetical protein
MGFSFLSGSNFTIFIGIFVTLAVMGTATLYDRYKTTGKTPFNEKQLKFLSDTNQKIKELYSKGMSSLSELSKKLIAWISKTIGEEKFENIKTKIVDLKEKTQEKIGALQNKITSSPAFISLKNKLNSGKNAQQVNKKDEASELAQFDKISNPDVDKIVESKKDEFSFDDDMLTKKSTASTIKDKDNLENKASAGLNSDSVIDENEFNVKFEEPNAEASPEGNLIVNTNSSEINIADEHDSLLDSLKKDIVTSSEKKVDFMANMKDENLDLKLIKSDLEDVLKNLKKYKQQANNS